MSTAAASEVKDQAASEVQVQNFVKQLRDHGIKMVVFDLDLTACKMHSGGVLDRKKLPDYLSAISPDFQKVVPVLFAEDFYLSICTFTDSYYYEDEGGDSRFPKDKFIAGDGPDDLVGVFLKKHFDDKTRDAFVNVGYNPSIHPKEAVANNKNYHLKELLVKFHKKNPSKELKMSECILFDDTKKNVDEAEGFKAYQVPRTGFRLPINFSAVKNKN